MPPRRRLTASEEKERIAAEEERNGPMLNEGCESPVEVVFAGHPRIHHMDLKPKRARRGFGVGDFGLTEGTIRIDEIVDQWRWASAHAGAPVFSTRASR